MSEVEWEEGRGVEVEAEAEEDEEARREAMRSGRDGKR